MTDTLSGSVTENHARLTDRLRTAETSHPTTQRPRDLHVAVDPFLASASRHVAAANAVLAPAARRHLADGKERARTLERHSRRLEQALFAAKSKLYGSTYAIRRPWAQVWGEVETALQEFWSTEERLVSDLVATLGPDDAEGLAVALYRREERVPTRPHPYLPHHGMRGRVARTVASRVDRFWDTAEGRMVPEPVRPHRTRDGRLTRYLLASADLPEDEPGAQP